MTFEIFRSGVMTFRSSRERLDCACSAKRELAFELFSEILRARVDGSDMASFDGVVLGSFVAQVKGIRFSDFGVSGARAYRGESVVVGRRPDNVSWTMCTMCGTAGCQLRNTPIHLVCATLTSFLLGN